MKTIESVTFCCVEFEDGSFPNDIVWCACNGAHVTGCRVHVRWPDGQEYHGTYKTLRQADVYKVGVVVVVNSTLSPPP